MLLLLFILGFIFGFSNIGHTQTELDGQRIIFNDFDPFPGTFWLGETIRFNPEITPSGRMLRQVGNPQAGSHTVYSNTSVYYGSWEFSVLFDGFTTSNQNRAWIWLMADDSETPNGYAVRIGESGTMKYARLFKLRGLEPPVEILQSSRVLPDDNRQFKLRVERTADGLWRLGVQTHFETTWQWSHTVDDSAPFFAPFFGFHTNFSSTRADRFLFGPVSIVKEPTFVRGVRVVSAQKLAIDLSDFQSEPLIGASDIVIRDPNGSVTTASGVRAEGFSIIAELSEHLRGGSYQIEIKSLRDIHSNQPQAGSFYTFQVFDSASFGDIIINELTPRVQDGTTPQFVELLNNSQKFINLSGWTIGRSTQSAIFNDISLSPGEYLIVGRPSALSYFSNRENFHALNMPALSRNQDNVWLRSASGELIDSVAYSQTLTNRLLEGQSIERIESDYPGIDPVNWAPNSGRYHTAGSVNSTSTMELPELRLVNVRLLNDELLKADFNLFLSRHENVSFQLNGRVLSVADWRWDSANSITLALGGHNEWIGQRSGVFSASNIQRAGLSDDSFFELEVAQPIMRTGDLLINEILYQPIQGRYNIFPDQSEFIEFYNTLPFAIDLSDVFLADTPDKHGQYRVWEPENILNWRIDGHGYGIIHADTSRLWYDTRLAQFFKISEQSSYARVNRSTLGLTSSGRGVYLRTSEQVIDSVYYNPVWHHPYVHDTRGRSLERIEHSRSENVTWSSSVAVKGGTPGDINSIGMPPGASYTNVSGRPGVYLHPNPFSPDFDGISDFTEISVITPSDGYSITLQIFNRFGRLIRTLERDQLVGHTKTIIWNGTDKNGTLQPTGIYIVYAELKHPSLRSIYYKEPLVLVRKN